MKKIILMLLTLLFLIGCKGEDGADGADGVNGGDTAVVSSPSGKIETAFCKKGTIVWAESVDATWTKSGALNGEVKTNDGGYTIRGDFSGPFISYVVPSGTCFNEADNTYVSNVILRMMQHNSATTHNINYATSLEYYIGEDHFFNPASPGYGSIPTAFTLAKSQIYSYMNFPSSQKDFHELSVVGDTTADAYLLAFETVVSAGRTGPEIYDYIAELGQAILNNDMTLRAEIRQSALDIKVKEVTENIRLERVRLGFSDDVAPLWNLPIYPSYYADLMTRYPSIIEFQNAGVGTSCSFDTDGYNKFAHPVVYDASVDAANYIAANLVGDISIWTATICDNGDATFDCPGSKLIDVLELNENLLPGGLTYNGSLGVHTLASLTNYFIVQEQTTEFRPLKSCSSGDLLEFGRSLALPVGDSNWNNAIGYNATAPWYRRKIEQLITD